MERKPFKLVHLKFEHFYFNSGEFDNGSPVSTAALIYLKHDFTNNNDYWIRKVTHRFYSLDGTTKKCEETFEEPFSLGSEAVSKIEKFDLRDLKNNYFTEEVPERFSRFEITYNAHFKIVGTYDNILPEIDNILEILNFRDLCVSALKRIETKKKR